MYVNGSVSVGTSPTLIVSPSRNDGGVLVQNTSTSAVFLGGSSVATSGADIGYSLAASSTVTVPAVGGSNDASSAAAGLYGIVASGTATVVYLAPSGV
jgi:hypothetical protein